MKELLLSDVKSFRYERKFYITELNKFEIEYAIKLHPAFFKEIYYERAVNNVYFDTIEMDHYFDNVNGENERIKVRIRWYGDLFGFVKEPVLEIKIKHNLHVGKLAYTLKPFSLDSNFSIDTAHKIFSEANVSDKLKLFLKKHIFSLLNTYRRTYFLSSDRKYRITIDNNLKAYRLSPRSNNFLKKIEDNNCVILELKYNEESNKFADNLTNAFPFRMTRSSKYVKAINELFVD